MHGKFTCSHAVFTPVARLGYNMVRGGGRIGCWLATPRTKYGPVSKGHLARDTLSAGIVKEGIVNKIEAIIRPEKLPSVRDALNEAGFMGMTIIRSEGRGDNLGVRRRAGRGTTTYVDYTLSNVKLEIVVNDEDTDKVLDVITETANTGQPGDGRIFVYQVVDTVRIDTRERGATTL